MNEDEFFNPDQIVENIAALLGIDKSRIRFMEVVSASGGRRRRDVDGDGQSYLTVSKPSHSIHPLLSLFIH